MIIDLTQIPTFVISMRDAHYRRQHITQQLITVGIAPTFVDGVSCWPGIIGCGLSHLKLLAQAPTTPFLVLEDDCAVTEAFRPTIRREWTTDAIYLGVSSWGIDQPSDRQARANATKVTRFNDDWLQVHNMCSSHAILHVSQYYVVQLRESIAECLAREIPFDIGYARLQSTHTVLTPNEPFFYQSGTVGGAEEATRITLQELSAT